MGGYFTKRMMFLLLTSIMLLLPLLISSSSSGEPVNYNKEGPPFSSSESEGKLTKLADLEFEDLNVRNVYNGKTCCSASRMLSVSLAVKSLATYGEAAKDCLDLFELLECSICQSRTLPLCASFCDRFFEACSDAYFSSDATNQVIVPCGARESIICGKASKWETNGTAFCYALGFTVQSAVDSSEEPCYGSKSCLEEPPFVVEEQPPRIKTEYSARFHWLQVSWLVTVLVLRTMLLKRWRDHQQMRAMIQRMREE